MSATPPPRPVVIDTDPGIDDALALLLALRSPELHIELLTTVAGNVPVPLATLNARTILGLMPSSSWPTVAEGSSRPLRRPLSTATAVHGDDGLGGLTTLRTPTGAAAYPAPEVLPVQRQAVARLVRTVQQHGRALTVIALGPLTNIARAIQQAPEVMRQLGRLVIMGGAIAVPGNITPVAEFNIYVDPHAAAIVFGAGIPTTLVPLDVTHRVRLTRDFLPSDQQAASSVLAQALIALTHHPLRRGRDGMALHDPLAVAVALDPSLVTCTPLPVWVETRGVHTLGMTVADRRAATASTTALPHLEVALEVHTSRVLELCATRLLS